MTATYEQAKGDMFTLVKAARDAESTMAGLYTNWQGVPQNPGDKPSQDEEWIQVSIRHDQTGSRQASLACHHGRRRWRREGSLFIQCFAPLQSGGLKRAITMASIFRDAIQASTGTPHGVWFRNPAATEGDTEKNWEYALASARFTYDEVK